MRIILVGKVRL